MATKNKWQTTLIDGVWVGSAPCYPDIRGHFIVSFETSALPAQETDFVQDNLSFSKKNVVRGLHTQQNQWQLVTIALGEIIYFCLDVNLYSQTYGQIVMTSLSPGGANQIYGRPGVAHGFFVLSDFAVLNYKSSVKYGETLEYVININPFIQRLDMRDAIRSKRDEEAKEFKDFKHAKGYDLFQKELQRFK